MIVCICKTTYCNSSKKLNQTNLYILRVQGFRIPTYYIGCIILCACVMLYIYMWQEVAIYIYITYICKQVKSSKHGADRIECVTRKFFLRSKWYSLCIGCSRLDCDLEITPALATITFFAFINTRSLWCECFKYLHWNLRTQKCD